jgi:uncharacterized protein (UPF0335 family)
MCRPFAPQWPSCPSPRAAERALATEWRAAADPPCSPPPVRARSPSHPLPQEFRAMADPTDQYAVTADELRQFIERAEQLAAEKRDIAEQEKEVFAEAKGRGYDTKVLRKVIALRKRKPDELAEEEAVLELYKAALGMT